MENNTFKLNKDFFSLFEVINQACSVVSHVSNKKRINLVTQEIDIEDQKYFL